MAGSAILTSARFGTRSGQTPCAAGRLRQCSRSLKHVIHVFNENRQGVEGSHSGPCTEPKVPVQLEDFFGLLVQCIPLCLL